MPAPISTWGSRYRRTTGGGYCTKTQQNWPNNCQLPQLPPEMVPDPGPSPGGPHAAPAALSATAPRRRLPRPQPRPPAAKVRCGKVREVLPRPSPLGPGPTDLDLYYILAYTEEWGSPAGGRPPGSFPPEGGYRARRRVSRWPNDNSGPPACLQRRAGSAAPSPNGDNGRTVTKRSERSPAVAWHRYQTGCNGHRRRGTVTKRL